MKNKIAYVVSDLKRVGPTNQTLNIIKYSMFKENSMVITLFNEPSDTQIEEYRKENIKVICLNLNRKSFFIGGIKKLIKALEQNNIKIVHSYGIIPDFLSQRCCKKSRIKHVITLRNYPKEDILSRMNRIKGFICLKLHLNVLKKAKYLVCCSKTICNKMKNDFPNNKISYIQNGVDLTKYISLKEEERNELKRKMGYDSKKIFISTGSFIPRKRIDESIQIFSKIKEENKLFLLLGDGILFDEISSKYKCDEICFLGKKNNVLDYLQISDYFISSSESEGLPNSVIESISCGVPVILSNIEQHKEIFEEIGDVGQLYELGNVNDAIKNYNNIDSDKYNLYQKNTKKIQSSNLSMQSMSKKYCEYYKLLGDLNG